MSDLEKLGGLEYAQKIAECQKEEMLDSELTFALIAHVKELERESSTWETTCDEWKELSKRQEAILLSQQDELQSARELAEMVVKQPDTKVYKWFQTIQAKAREFLEKVK